MFSDNAIQELQELARQEKRIADDTREWWNKYAKHLFDKCTTIDEWKMVCRALPRTVDNNNEMIDKPGNFNVYMAISFDAITNKN